jgi:hypothetical protein
MMWLFTRPVVWPTKVAFGTGRLLGYRRLTVFLLGVVVGMLLAPMAGYELRKLVRERLMPEGTDAWTPDEVPAPTTTSW